MTITRFAPSPTGSFHIGSLRTAIYNYLFAKKNKGKFILRIEDTDELRSNKKFLDEIIEIFQIFELDYDKLEYQSKNINIHIDFLEILIKKNYVYKSDEGPYKFKVNREVDSFSYKDVILGLIKIPNENIEDFSVARSNKKPTFILSNMIDDHLDQITNVIRGNDHSINTIKQIMLSQALSFIPIKYAHIPLIHDLKGKKLSKRNNVTNVSGYIDMGYRKEALFNFIIKLGNNFNDIEILDKEKSIKNFELNKTVLSPAKFDIDKLNYYNNYYLENLSYDDFISCIKKETMKKIKNFNIKEVFKPILKRSFNNEDINNELKNLVEFIYEKKTYNILKNEIMLLKQIQNTTKESQTYDIFIEKLEKNDLSFKKTGKLLRKILVNFNSKLPIESIIKFFGIKIVNDMISAITENE
ncbi:MAG: hypothetical protein CMI90_06250 [Pelagibacteraceae bacterium]|nr:hypothetical protein [Pelagibacteraceae bacterium]